PRGRTSPARSPPPAPRSSARAACKDDTHLTLSNPMPSMTRYESRIAKGTPGRHDPRRRRDDTRARIRGDRGAEAPQRRNLRPAGGDGLSRPTSAGGGRVARKRLGDRRRAEAARVPAYPARALRARPAPSGVGGLL